jgi:hypothetical protein
MEQEAAIKLLDDAIEARRERYALSRTNRSTKPCRRPDKEAKSVPQKAAKAYPWEEV